MAKTKYDVELRLTGKDQASRAVKATDRAVQGLGRTAAKVGAMFGTYFGARALIRFSREAVAAAAAQEDAENRLAVALRDVNQYTDENLELLKKQASAYQLLTRYGDEEVMTVQRIMLGHKLETAEMEKAVQATLNLASAKGMDLASASELLGRAYEGETATLSRYGLMIDANLERGEKWEAVLRLINERFGSAAQADVHTYSGRVAQLSNVWGDVKEDMGDVVVQSREINALIETLTKEFVDAIEDGTTKFEGARVFIGDGVVSLIDVTGQLIAIIPGVGVAWNETSSIAIKGATALLRVVNRLSGATKGYYDDIISDLDAWAAKQEVEAQAWFNHYMKILNAKEDFKKRYLEILDETVVEEEKKRARSEEAAKKSFERQSEWAKRAAQNCERAWSDGFFNIMLARFDSLDDVVRSFYENMVRLSADMLARQVMTQLWPSMYSATAAAAGTPALPAPGASPAPPRPVDINITIDPATFSAPPSPEYINSVVAENFRRGGTVRLTARRHI